MKADDKRSVERLANRLGSERNTVERIRAELATRGWSQAELVRRMEAHATGSSGGVLHPVVLSKLLAGDRGRHISIDQLVTLAAVFEVSVAEMLLPPDAMRMAEALRALADGPGLLRAEILARGEAERGIEVVARAMLDDPHWRARIADDIEEAVSRAESQGRPPSDSVKVAFLARAVERYEQMKGGE